MIRVHDAAGNVIETHEQGRFPQFQNQGDHEAVRLRLYYREGAEALSVEEILSAGGPAKNKKARRKNNENSPSNQ